MSKPLSLSADLTQAESSLQIFPRSPVWVSNPTIGQGLFLAHHRQPAWEMPENHLSQVIISINLDSARKIERKLDGKLQRENFLPGNIAIYPAGVDYTLRWQQESEFLLVGLDLELLEQTAIANSSPARLDLIPLLSTPDPLIYHLALALKAELKSPQMGEIYVEAIAQTLALQLLRNYSSDRPKIATLTTSGLPQHKLQQITDCIRDRLEHDLSLAELAALVDISPFHFARLFKKSTGLAPHQFVIHARVMRAKELLLNSKLSIAEIATEVGFANQSHLNRHFKRIVGVTPRTVLGDRKIVPNPART